MKSIMIAEWKRILSKNNIIAFLVITLIFSVISTYQSVRRYEVWDETGRAVSGMDNIKYYRGSMSRYTIEEKLTLLSELEAESRYADDTTIEALTALNYDGKRIKELTDKEILDFYSHRLSKIARIVAESEKMKYTEAEKEELLKKAGQLSGLSMGYAEGWKAIIEDIGIVMFLILVLISIMIIPLFACDSQTKMNELCESTQNGKSLLDKARLVIAFGTGIGMYSTGILLFFFIKMLPFGMKGSGEQIQSNEETFFSVYTMSYFEQFMRKVLLGLAALVLIVSFTIFVSILIKGIMSGMSIVLFFWILLIIMEQMAQYPVNHGFANFMPLRLINAMDYYIGMELYHVAGISVLSITWCPLAAFLLSLLIFLGITILLGFKWRRKGLRNRYKICKMQIIRYIAHCKGYAAVVSPCKVSAATADLHRFL